ncbi:Phage antirepressor protein KilAC domain protein [compost metagenome]
MTAMALTAAAVTMSSRELAELTGKRHGDVIRDIRRMLDELGDDANLRHVREEKDGRGYTAEISLPRREVEILLTGYSVKLRARVIDRLRELEERAAPSIPQTLPDALRLAADLAEQNGALLRELTEQAPKVGVYERIADATGTLCLTDTAKHLGVKRKALLLWMQENRWIYRRTNSKRWLAYQPRLASGVLVHRIKNLGTDEHGDERVATQVRVTPKGLTALAKRVPRSPGGM